MNLIKNIWGDEKEKQFKAVTIFILICFFTLALFLLLFLRIFEIGESLPLSPFLYFFTIIFFAIIFLLKSKFYLSVFMVVLIFFELVMGYGGLVIYKFGFKNNFKSFLPVSKSSQFIFHPLLGGLPNPEFSKNKITHSLSSIRNSSKEFDITKEHIAVFGGSTTYDIYVSDKNTWVSQLSNLLPNYNFSNNGVPGYSTAEHVVQTAFYPDRAGKLPICSIYYIGWNDIRNYGFKNLDNGYSNFHLPSQYGNLELRYKPNTLSPLFNMIATYFGRNEFPFPVKEGNLVKDISTSDKLFEIVENNLNSIVALNNSRGIKTVFVAQLLNRNKLIDKKPYQWIPYVYLSDVWPLQHNFNLFVKKFADENNSGFIYPDIDKFLDDDFAGMGHFNKQGSLKFAQLIYSNIKDECKLN